MANVSEELEKYVNHRLTPETIQKMLEKAGFITINKKTLPEVPSLREG